MSILVSACGSRGDLYQVADPEVAPKPAIKATSTTVQPSSNNSNKKQA